MLTFSPRRSVQRLSLLGLLLVCFLLRPAAGGQSLTPVALLLIVAVAGVSLINSGFRVSRPSSHSLSVALLGIGLWVYLALYSVASGIGRTDFVAKSTIAHIVVIAASLLVFTDASSHRAFFRYLSICLMVPIVSYAVTASIAYFIGFDSLHLFSMTIEDYPGTGDVLFPITPVYTYIEVPGVRLVRLSGFFRESGIAQAFYGWGFVAAPFLWRRVLLVRTIFGAGMIFTISTAGIFLLGILIIAVSVLAIGMGASSRRRRALKLFSVAVVAGAVGFGTYYVNENVPVVGLKDKEERSVSADDRYDANAGSLQAISEHPLGLGLYTSTIPNSTINLIGSLREIGLPGLFLFLALYLGPPLLLRHKWYALLCVIPVLLTAISSQPLLDAPFAYLLLFFAPQRVVVSEKPAIMALSAGGDGTLSISNDATLTR